MDYCCISFVSLIIILDGIKRYKYLNGMYVLLRKAAGKVKVKYSVKPQPLKLWKDKKILSYHCYQILWVNKDRVDEGVKRPFLALYSHLNLNLYRGPSNQNFKL